jgi:hypothetical protein
LHRSRFQDADSRLRIENGRQQRGRYGAGRDRRTPLGMIQPSGASSLAAHISLLRGGRPREARSPRSIDGCAMTTDW